MESGMISSVHTSKVSSGLSDPVGWIDLNKYQECRLFVGRVAMRSLRVLWFVTVFWCACKGSGSPALVAADAAFEPGTDETTADLVRQALAAEANGRAGERAEFLQRALEQQPDYAPAHWQSGEVRVGDRWLSVD